MLSVEHISRCLQSVNLRKVEEDLKRAGESVSWNTLSKIRRGDATVQFAKLEIVSNYFEGVYDD